MNKTPLLLALAFLLTALAPVASAHASKAVGDGSIKITWGFLDEPAYVGVKNRLDLIVRDNATNQGIAGLTAANFTEVSLHLGDEEYALGNVSAYTGPKGASAGPGNYTTNVFVVPSREGIYVLHVAGKINGQEFDVEIPATHAMEPLEDITFPPEQAMDHDALVKRIGELEGRIAALEQKAKTQSETPATATTVSATPAKPAPAVGLALVALAVALVAVAARRRS